MAFEILLIDDDPEMSPMLCALLRGHDFQIRPVHSGIDGIQFCRANSPDVVILDLLMPDLDGWEVCHRIRQFSSVPILILSAVGSPEKVARALEAGADDYLIKPVHAGLLVSRLRMLVRRYALDRSVQTA